MQFRIRNLLFLTFVAALCGGLMSLHLAAGCVALIPITIAAVRTMRWSSARSGNEPTSSLGLAFAESLALLVALTAVSLLWAVASICVMFSAIVRIADRVARAGAAIAWRALLRLHVDSGLSMLGRWIVNCTSYLLVGMAALMVEFTLWLKRTNRTLYGQWSS